MFGGVCFANDITGLSTVEHAALFGDSSTVQVAALDNEEMKATEGKFFWMPLLWIGVRVGTMCGIRYAVWEQYSQRHHFWLEMVELKFARECVFR